MVQTIPTIPLRGGKVHHQKKGSSKSSPELLPVCDRGSHLHEDISSRVLDFQKKSGEPLHVPSLVEIKSGDYETFPNGMTVEKVLSFVHDNSPRKKFNHEKEAVRILQSPALKIILMSGSKRELIKELSFLYRENSERGYRTKLGKIMEDTAVSLLEHSFGRKSLEEKDRHGLDTIIQNELARYQVEMKTSENWGNTSSRAGTSVKFMKARHSALHVYKKTRIHSIVLNLSLYDTLPGFYWDENNYLQINGRHSWEFITTDPYFAVFLRLHNVYDMHKTDTITNNQVETLAEYILSSEYFTHQKAPENSGGMILSGNFFFDYTKNAPEESS